MKRRSLLALVLIAAVAGPTLAAPTPTPASAPLSAADQALVQKATDYIQSLNTAQARFTQTDAKGSVTTGVFSLQRPGKARFAYDAPASLTVVSDGYNVNVYDARLKTFDQYPLGQTPLVLLLARQVRLDRGVAITAVEHTNDGFTITARDAKKEAEGRISMIFADRPLMLKGWSVVDAQGLKTTVALDPLKTGVALNGELFVLRDPRPHVGRP
jgi:outer membrane lipoprotein-sorting protein